MSRGWSRSTAYYDALAIQAREKNAEGAPESGAPARNATASQVGPGVGRTPAIEQLRNAGLILNDLAPKKPVRFNQWSTATPAERFEVKVLRQPDPDCDLWQGSGDSDKGYGRFWLDGRKMPAHRAAWILANGPIPDGLHVCHTCDNPPCVKVAHLWLGTNADNVRDAVRKGRKKRASARSAVGCGPATDPAADLGAAVVHAAKAGEALSAPAASPTKKDEAPAHTGTSSTHHG